MCFLQSPNIKHTSSYFLSYLSNSYVLFFVQYSLADKTIKLKLTLILISFSWVLLHLLEWAALVKPLQRKALKPHGRLQLHQMQKHSRVVFSF